MHLRHPLLVIHGQGAGFGVDAPYPIAVDVEPVVVTATTRPGFVVLQITGFVAQNTALSGFVPINETVAPIWIDTDVEHDHRVVENPFGFFILCGGQAIGDLSYSLGRRGFIAVDVVAVGDKDGFGFDQIGHFRSAAIQEFEVALANALQVFVVLGRGNHQPDQGATFVGAAVLVQGDFVRKPIQFFDVVDGMGVKGELCAELIAKVLLGRGNVGVVSELGIEGESFFINQHGALGEELEAEEEEKK